MDYYKVYGDNEILDKYNHAKFVADLVVAIIIELEQMKGEENNSEHGNIT